MANMDAEVAGKPSACGPPSLKNIFIRSAQTHSDRIALVALHQASDLLPAVRKSDGTSTHLRWTYSDLFDGARLLAAALHRRGVRKGDPIAAVLYSSAEWYAIVTRVVLGDMC